MPRRRACGAPPSHPGSARPRLDRNSAGDKGGAGGVQLFHLTRVLSLTEELGCVADALARNGLPFASFKGIALATLHHGNRPLREFDDIDLIVPKPRLAEAEGVLRSLGYRGADGEPAFRNAFFAYQRQYAFVRTEPDVSVDLHWAFTSAPLPFPLDPAEIWADLQAGYRSVDVRFHPGGRQSRTAAGGPWDEGEMEAPRLGVRLRDLPRPQSRSRLVGAFSAPIGAAAATRFSSPAPWRSHCWAW